MANPVSTACAANVWTKVATNVTTGMIHKELTAPRYLQTYRTTGGAVPTAGDPSEGTPIFIDKENDEPISATAAIDVYIFPIGAAGSVRVDL